MRRWPSQMLGREPSGVLIVHGHPDPGPGAMKPIRERDLLIVEEPGDEHVVEVRPGSRGGAAMVARSSRSTWSLCACRPAHRRPIIRARRIQHSAQQHLVDPVDALARAPVGNRSISVVEREDQVGTRTAHPLRRDRRHITQLVVELCTRAFISGLTLAPSLITRLTVCSETPATAATCLIVTAWRRRPRGFGSGLSAAMIHRGIRRPAIAGRYKRNDRAGRRRSARHCRGWSRAAWSSRHC